ncbi:MAG TPA: MFS transporter [Ktedonobacteraceae bacterium]|nr:MFS transporter [Ktedonobacteraceae bacterium]
MKAKAVSSSSPSISLAFFGFVLIGISGGANGVLLPSLSNYYHVGDAIIGLLFLVSSLGYFLSALSSGLMAERLGLRWLLVLGAIILLPGLLGFGLKLPFVVLLFARLLAGLGVGIIETGFNIFITALPRSTTLLNFLHAFYGAGALVGPLIASTILALAWGWNSFYLLMVALSLPLLLGLTTFFRLPADAAPTQEGVPTGKENVLTATLKLPIVWVTAIFLLVYVGIEVSLGNWTYTFLLEARQQGTVAAGWIVSGFWLGFTLGRFTLQAMAEKLGIGTKTLMYACMVGLGFGLLLVWLIPLGAIAAIGFCFLGFSIAPIYPLTVSIAPKLVPARLAPSTIGLLVSVSIIGLALFPWIAGILAQFVGIWTLLPYTLALTIIMLAFWQYLTGHTTLSEMTLHH